MIGLPLDDAVLGDIELLSSLFLLLFIDAHHNAADLGFLYFGLQMQIAHILDHRVGL